MFDCCLTMPEIVDGEDYEMLFISAYWLYANCLIVV